MKKCLRDLSFAVPGIFCLCCSHDPQRVPEVSGINGYPAEIGEIVKTRCAVAGCHNQSSADAAAGLDLSTWESAFRGRRNNAVIVPFSPFKSTFFLTVNHFEELGPALSPTMPYGRPPLSKMEVLRIMDWINSGAQNEEGEIAFTQTDVNQKLYILNSLCREVAVADLETGLVIRYINLGQDESLGFATWVLLHPTLPFWYVLFTNGLVQQFDAGTDQWTRSYQLPPGTWRTLEPSADGNSLYAVNWQGNTDFQGGQVAVLEASSLLPDTILSFAGDSVYFPIGWAEAAGQYYTACYLGNFIYKIDLSNESVAVSKIPLSSEPVEYNVSTYRPTAVTFSGNQGSYFVACEQSGEVRRFNALNDELQAVIPVGFFPQQMIVDESQGLLFVSCTEDVETFDEGKSAVYIIDLQTNEVVTTIYAGYQSRALALDQQHGWLYVANRNADPVGSDEPHHYSDCDGRNGYLSRISLKDLTADPGFRAELSVDPYSMSLR